MTVLADAEAAVVGANWGRGPEEMAAIAAQTVDARPGGLVGGCRGSTPVHIETISRALG